MTTPGEKIVLLEALSARNRERIERLHDDIHGGPSVEWAQSIRGRLHTMQSAIEAADKLADATRELVREQKRARESRFKTWQLVTATAIGLLTAAAPYVILLTH
jgi:hypothetical protein